MIIDLLAVLPWYLQPFFSMDLRALRVLRLFRLLKLVRYSPALQTLGRVIEDEYRALLGALLVHSPTSSARSRRPSGGRFRP